jgi:hypothetical protein
MTLAVCAVVVVFVGSAPAQPAAWPPPRTDDHWSRFWATSPTGSFANGPVHADVTPNGSVWTTGVEFGGARVGLAFWNGQAWAKQAGYLTGTGFTAVTAIEADANGNVYVAGFFDTGVNPDGSTVALSNVAHWDDNTKTWRALGQGLVGNAYTVDVDRSGRVAFGGNFTHAVDTNGSIVNSSRCVIWDPMAGAWSPLGSGLDGGVFRLEYAPNGDLVITGGFTSGIDPGGTSVAMGRVGAWDGTGFVAFGQGITSTSGVGDLAINSAGDVFFAADGLAAMNDDGTTAAGNVIRWSGGRFSAMPAVPAQFVERIEASANALYVMASQQFVQIVFHNVGGVWTPIGRPIGEIATVLDAEPEFGGVRLYLGGLLFNIEYPPTGVIRRAVNNTLWNGLYWAEMRSAGASGIVRTIGGSFSHAIAGGNFGTVSGIEVNNVAKFDGTNWSALGKGTNGEVRAILPKLGRNETVHVVGGSFGAVADAAGNTLPVQNIARYDVGGGWSSLGGGVTGPVHALACLVDAVSFPEEPYIYVGGQFDRGINPDGSEVFSDNLIRWNVSSARWESLGGVTGGPNAAVEALGVFDDYVYDVWVGGSFTTATDSTGVSTSVSNFVQFRRGYEDYVAPLGGVDGPVHAIEVAGWYGDALVYVGGDFQQALGPQGNATMPYATIWRPDDQIYYPVGQGFNGPIHSIERTQTFGWQTKVALAGDFDQAYDIDGRVVSAGHIAQYDAHTGRFLNYGSGTNDRIHAMFHAGFCSWSAGENLFVGGEFTHVGFVPARSLARWKYTIPPRTPTMIAVHTGGGGGSGRSVKAVMSLPPCTPLAGGTDTVVLMDDRGFGEGAFAEALAVDTTLTIDVYPPGDPGNPIATIGGVVIDSQGPHAIVVYGIENAAGYAPNPDGLPTAIDVAVVDLGGGALPIGAPRGSPSCRVVFFHTITDAPAIDVVIPSAGTVASAIPYGAGSTPVDVSAGPQVVEIRRSSDQQLLGNDTIDFGGMDGRVATVMLGGFVDPASNQNGPPVGCWAFDENGVDLTLDSDGDGIRDVEDACVSSVLGGVLDVGGCDPGVTNALLPSGCSMQDRLDSCPPGGSARRALCVRRLANEWAASGALSESERARLIACAGALDLATLPTPRDSAARGVSAEAFGLRLAGRNPTSSRARIAFALDRAENVDLAVYDVRGRRVRDLVSGVRREGAYDVIWDLRDGRGTRVGAGVYFVRLVGPGRARVERVTVLD